MIKTTIRKTTACKKSSTVRFLRLFIFFIIFTNLVLFFGCLKNDDNPVDPTKKIISVTGKITDYSGTGIPNMKIETSSSMYLSSSDGSFTIPGIYSPYDITVYTDIMKVETFKDLTSTTPVLPVDISFYNPSYYAEITVTIPQYSNNQNAIAIFYDDSGKNSKEQMFYGNISSVINYSWNGSATTTGKIAVFVYTKDNQNKIISYDKYGEKPIAITSGNSSSIVFNEIDLNTNPIDSTISGTVVLPLGFKIEGVEIGMNRFNFANSFYNGHKFNNILINNSSYSVLIPILNGNIYKYFAEITIRNPGNYSGGSKVAEIYPNNSNIFVLNIIPTLLSPVNNAQSVNYNTQFSFSKDTPQGIYKIGFSYINNYNSSINRYIYLNSETINLSPLSIDSYNIADEYESKWWVTKIAGYNSTDEFVSIPPNLNPLYKEILQSEVRTFQTKLNTK